MLSAKKKVPFAIPRKRSSNWKQQSEITTSQFVDICYNQNVLIIDTRPVGKFRGGSSEGISQCYHQGHFITAININISSLNDIAEIQKEIETGASSAGNFLHSIIVAIKISDYHILFYDQDGSTKNFDNLRSVEINYKNENYQLPQERIHKLKGGYESLYNSHLRRFCLDTKTLLGAEEHIEDTEYSIISDHLYLGSSCCSAQQYQCLRERGVNYILNISNIDAAPEGFKYDFFLTNDDDTETISRLFRQCADLIADEIKQGNGVFVHCQRGLSRSPTLVMAYLIVKEHFTLRQAYELLKRERPNIGPRSNFIVDLSFLELEVGKEIGVNRERFSLPTQVYELVMNRCINYSDAMDYYNSRKEESCLLM